MKDILNRITKLRQERKWSEYELAKNSGLTQSTISTWYRKDQVPTIPTLKKVCDAFGITWSQFLDVYKRQGKYYAVSQLTGNKMLDIIIGKYTACLLYTSFLSHRNRNPVRPEPSFGKIFSQLSNLQICILFIPVSYTHLDVYKRQKQRFSSAAWACSNGAVDIASLTTEMFCI